MLYNEHFLPFQTLRQSHSKNPAPLHPPPPRHLERKMAGSRSTCCPGYFLGGGGGWGQLLRRYIHSAIFLPPSAAQEQRTVHLHHNVSLSRTSGSYYILDSICRGKPSNMLREFKCSLSELGKKKRRRSGDWWQQLPLTVWNGRRWAST